ncbi:MAG: putative type II secretion system protein F [candidate division BRC1 bacterium ADurb.Bin183]|nr:MAG: putative type II secretion system protein F [candidate division BRC1 bacterium ADurb.Bin183]
MMNFQYRAMNGEGAIMEGVLSAQSRRDAIRKLESMGLDPVKIEQGAASSEPDKQTLSFFSRNKKISSADLESFTRQLSSLLSAGVPLSRALNIIQRETPSAAAKEKWGEIHDLVIDGSSLADAMRQSPENFPAVYVAMVQAGETGGFLDIVLGEIAEFQARQRDLKSRTISALIYPLVLMVLALCVLIFLLVFFIPRFKIIFSGFGAQLPLLTRIIVGVSDNIAAYGPILAIIAAVGILLIRKWFRSEQGRRQWQMALLRLPVVGAIMAKFAMTRFCRMLGTLVASGVPLISALSVARESIGNQTLSDAMTSAIDRVRQGSSLAASLSDCRALFPGSVIEMISVAEESGRLDKELLRLAQETEHELDRRLRTAVALLEPLMLFVMAGFIGTIFIGMVIPIFTLQDYIK